jgi:hypothetical protein
MENILGWLNNEVLRGFWRKDLPNWAREPLRQLVRAWEDSGRNVQKMSHAGLKEYLWGAAHFPPPHVGLIPYGSGLQLEVRLDVASPRRDIDCVSLPARIADMAYAIFVDLLIHPWRDKLCEKPCARCDEYYIKKTARQKVYCSRKCAKDGTAAFATKKRLQEQRASKLQVAAEEAQRWTTATTKLDWKHWVSRQRAGRKAEITPKFLTRAVNKGEIKPPTKGS